MQKLSKAAIATRRAARWLLFLMDRFAREITLNTSRALVLLLSKHCLQCFKRVCWLINQYVETRMLHND